MASAPRLRPALRVLARRRAYLAALGAAWLALTLVLALVLGVVLLVARLLPAEWPAAQVGLLVAALVYAPILALACSWLAAGIRGITLFTAVSDQRGAGLVGGLGGLGLFLLARRFRVRRSVLTWLTDPMGSAAGYAASRVLPLGNPLEALAEMEGLDPPRNPARGAGWLTLGVWAAGLAAYVLAGLGPAPLESVVALLLVPLIPFGAVLGAGVRGVLAGAWDRYLLERTAGSIDDTLAWVQGAIHRGAAGGPGFAR
ncbi:MAG: hypothetical protein LC624_00135 [Halobacteriales archaeon]|nr:hypothetical protein [Halobacteriales archaeon]